MGNSGESASCGRSWLGPGVGAAADFCTSSILYFGFDIEATFVSPLTYDATQHWKKGENRRTRRHGETARNKAD